MAAIQALYSDSKKKDAQIEILQQEVIQLQKKLSSLNELKSELEFLKLILNNLSSKSMK
jgi:prefoldin subunit 5